MRATGNHTPRYRIAGSAEPSRSDRASPPAIATQRKRHRRGEVARELGDEFERPAWRNVEFYRVSMRAVFTRPLKAFGLRRIVIGNVVNFVAGVEPFHDLQRADLTSSRSRVEEVSFDPQNSHATWTLLVATGIRPSQNCSRRPVRYMSPQTCRLSSRQIRSVASCWPWSCLASRLSRYSKLT